MLEYSILIWGINLEASLGEHAYKGYARFNDVHRLFWADLNNALIALALTMHGHVKVEVYFYFKFATVLEPESFQ